MHLLDSRVVSLRCLCFLQTVQAPAGFSFDGVGSICLAKWPQCCACSHCCKYLINSRPFRLYSDVPVLTLKFPLSLNVCSHGDMCASLAVKFLQNVCLQFRMRWSKLSVSCVARSALQRLRQDFSMLIPVSDTTLKFLAGTKRVVADRACLQDLVEVI